MRYLEEIFSIGDYLNPKLNKRCNTYVEDFSHKINTFSTLRETYIQLMIELHCQK